MARPDCSDRVFARRTLIAVAIVAAVAAAVLLLRELTQILLVFFAAVLFAIMLDGLSGLLVRFLRLPRSLALFAVCALIVGVIAAFGWFMGPQIGQQLAELGQRLPRAVDQAAQRLQQYAWFGRILEQLPEPDGTFDRQLLGRLTGIFSTAFGIVFNTVVILVVGLYLAVNPNTYVAVVLRLVPAEGRPRGRLMLETMASAMKRWLVGRLVTMVFIGVGTAVALWLIGMQLAFSLGLIAGLLNFIPYLGPVLSAVPALLIAFADGPQMVLYVALIYIGVQSIESYLVDPLVERRSVYIPPGFQIPVQLMAGVLAGFMGLLLATPLVVIATVAVQMLYLERVLGEHPKVIGNR